MVLCTSGGAGANCIAFKARLRSFCGVDGDGILLRAAAFFDKKPGLQVGSDDRGRIDNGGDGVNTNHAPTDNGNFGGGAIVVL